MENLEIWLNTVHQINCQFISKTIYIIIATPQKKVSVKMTTCDIQQKLDIQYLGIIILMQI